MPDLSDLPDDTKIKARTWLDALTKIALILFVFVLGIISHCVYTK